MQTLYVEGPILKRGVVTYLYCVLSCVCFAVGQGHVFLTQAVIFATTHLTAFMMHHDHLARRLYVFVE